MDSLYVNYAGTKITNYSDTKTIRFFSVQGRIGISNKQMRWTPRIVISHSEVLSPVIYQDEHGQQSTSASFRVLRWSRFSELLIPFWFLVFSSGALAIAPWIRWRFSLLTMLIAITALAVLLGLIVWAVR
jgi:hypothetical protein